MTPTPTTIELEICLKLIAAVKDGHTLLRTPDWTRAMKQAMGELGVKKGYKICGWDTHEWLYDLVWYKDNGEEMYDYRLEEVVLVMESEWGMHINNITEDFDKLLVANATYRVMVCYVHVGNAEEVWRYIRESIQGYTQGKDGDRFLVCMLDWEKAEQGQYEQAFEFRLAVKGHGMVNCTP